MNIPYIIFNSEKDPNHSHSRDYSISYGQNSLASKDIDEGKSYSKKQQRESGLTDRKPL